MPNQATEPHAQRMGELPPVPYSMTQPNHTVDSAPLWMTKAQYAAHRSISIRTLEGMMSEGAIPYFKGGGRKQSHVRINVFDADRALERYYRRVPTAN